MPESRASRVAYYAVPILFCVAVHWIALKTWFWGDDFAWLGLHEEITTYNDWWDVLFGPRAQGTVRVLSDRLYFLVFTWLFGLNAAPFRIWVFLTQFANLVLVAGIARRLTGSRLAGFLAPIIWSANAALATSLGWSAAYNEVCCAFFLLFSFWLLLRYFDTNNLKYWIWQWVVFLLGFGSLELIVMYPAIASLYTLLWDRSRFRRTLWLFIPSALFTAAHFAYVPKSTDPHYQMHFSPEILNILWQYWAFGVAAYRADVVDWRPLWLGLSVALLAAGAVAAFSSKRPRVAAFCLGWGLLVLSPVLPLTDHFTEYYMTIPSIGLALLAAFAIAEYPKVAIPLVVLSMMLSISDLHVTDRFHYERARKLKRIVNGLQSARASYAGKQVIVTGVDNDLFWSGFADDPFRLIGIPHLFLSPGTENSIEQHPEWGGIAKFVTPLEPALQAIKQNKAIVFAIASDGNLRDVTHSYDTIASSQYLSEHRDKVDVGDPLYASRVGQGWYPAEKGFRWMGKSASVELGGPTGAGQSLIVSGYCPALVLAQGPLDLSIRADGEKLGSTSLTKPDKKFEASFPLPLNLEGKYMMNVTVEVSRTTRSASDVRPLGLIFGTFRIQ